MSKKGTKLCKHCQNKISKKENICPNYNKNHSGKLKWFIVAIIVLAIIGTTAGCGDDNEPNASEETIMPTVSNNDEPDSSEEITPPTISNDNEPDSSEEINPPTVSEQENTESTLPSEAGSDLLSEAEILESNVYNGFGTEILGKSGCIRAPGYDISYGETSDFESLCNRIEKLKDKYMWFTLDFCDGTGVVFIGCVYPVYAEIDNSQSLIEEIGYLWKTDNGYTYEEFTDDTETDFLSAP